MPKISRRPLVCLSFVCLLAPSAAFAEAVPSAEGPKASATELVQEVAPVEVKVEKVDKPEQVAPPATSDSVEQLEQELSSVMDELIQARTRTAVLTKALFRTPLKVTVARRSKAQRLAHITLRLDGVPVHDSDGASLSSGEAQLFEGFAAPGMHEVSVEIMEEAKENAAYRYVRHERFRLEIKKDTQTHIELILDDDSDMADKLPRKNRGEYDVRTRLRVRAEKVAKDG